jgi:predicted flap endonuclease-1-like 5' DNA nuclease
LRYVTLQGKAIWALVFFSVLSGLNAVTAIVLAIELGIEGSFEPYLLGSLTGGIPVYVYLIASMIATLAFLGGTSAKVVSELSNKALLHEINAKVTTIESGQKLQQKVLESLQARVFLVDEGVNSMRKEVAKAFAKQEEEMKQVQANLIKKFSSDLADVKAEMARQLKAQNKEIKEINENLVNLFTKNLADTKDELTRELVGIENTMAANERSNKKMEKAFSKQKEEIGNVKLDLERLEAEFISPKAQLTSDSKTEDVRGIGENTEKELREMGITSVGELVLADPAVIAAKTGMSEKIVEKLQGRAQLAMVPGVGDRDLVLLEEVGITNRKELADQDPLELGRRINGVFAFCVEKGKITEAEKPKIEEIYSWVKFAKT